MPRMIPRQTRRSTLSSIAILAGVSKDTAHDVLCAQTALILEDLAAGRSAPLLELGHIRIRRRGGALRATIRPAAPLARVLTHLGEVFE